MSKRILSLAEWREEMEELTSYSFRRYLYLWIDKRLLDYIVENDSRRRLLGAFLSYIYK
jgi:hypothetical protein